MQERIKEVVREVGKLERKVKQKQESPNVDES